MSESEPERLMALHLRTSHLPVPAREHVFHPTRRWRFDFAWPERRVALEVEGGTHTQGRHTRAPGFTNDCEKYNEAALLGWVVLRVTPAMVEDGRALNYLERALEHYFQHEQQVLRNTQLIKEQP